MMRLLISILFVLFLLNPPYCHNVGRKPPSNKKLVYKRSATLDPIPNSIHYSASILGTERYQAPDSSGDCRNPQNATHVFTMANPTDYIQFQLTDYAGVAPGIGNSRGYILIKNDNKPDSQSWFLTMRQISPATSYLHHELWVLQLNAIENPSAELGNGTDFAPLTGLGFPRKFTGGPIGGEYKLVIQNGTTIGRLTPVLNFNIENTVSVCH